ncbi:MAG: DUF4126 domain-containing protein [Phycisphaerales bacterium]
MTTGEVFSMALAVLGGVALAAACGLRVFVPMLVLSVASKAGVVPLGSQFAWIASTPALVSFSVASVLEVTAFYWPWLDHVLDAVAMPCSITAGTLAVASQITHADPWMSWVVGIVAGGGAAGLVQSGTILLRGLSLATTGGLGNPVVATAENVGALLLAAVAVLIPVMAVLLMGLVLFMVLFTLHKRREARRARLAAA